MDKLALPKALLEGFRQVSPNATGEDILVACRSLFTNSDPYVHATPPMTPSEVDAVARMLFEYICDPGNPHLRMIDFGTDRALLGRSLDVNEFMSMFSSDILTECITRITATPSSDSRPILLSCFAGMCLRYAHCAHSDLAVFPMSAVLTYYQAVMLMPSAKDSNASREQTLFLTLNALSSLEPTIETLKRMQQHNDKYSK